MLTIFCYHFNSDWHRTDDRVAGILAFWRWNKNFILKLAKLTELCSDSLPPQICVGTNSEMGATPNRNRWTVVKQSSAKGNLTRG